MSLHTLNCVTVGGVVFRELGASVVPAVCLVGAHVETV